MNQLLIVAHGSRREASNDEVRALANKLRGMHSSFDSVEAAFLELAEPSIPDGLRKAITRGANQVTIFPYFLSAGRHVTEDIPAEIQRVREEFPNIEMTLVDYLGAAGGIPELLLKQASQSVES